MRIGKVIVCYFLLGFLNPIEARSGITTRVPQLTNSRVTIWKTTIYPTAKKQLKMHRHDHDRVIIAFTDGVLKIVNNKGNVHYLTLKKNESYYLPKDINNEWHTDENMSHHPIEVMVIELKTP